MSLQTDRWWNAEPSLLAAETVAEARRVDRATLARRMQILEAYCLYGDETAIPENAIEIRSQPQVTRNVLALAVDTVISEITQARPRPMFVTIGGDWLEQERARKLTYFCDAEFDQNNVHELAEQAARDAVIAGLGILRPRRDPSDETRVIIERIFPPNFLVDDRGAVDVLPRSFFVRHLLDKWQLCELYPDQRAAIEMAATVESNAWFSDGPKGQDLVEVIEGVHLPSRKGSTDGRHVLVIAEAVLSDEQYNYAEPPFVFIRAVKPLRRFWGLSLVQRAAPTQIELNRVLRRWNESLRLNATSLWFLNRQSRVVKAHMVNQIGAIVEHDGPPPQQMTPAVMHPQVANYIEQCEARVFKLMGASELAATSMKPAGLNSGRALQVYNDVQSRRFIGLERAFEGLYVDLAKWVVTMHTEIAEDYPEHEIVCSDGPSRTTRIKWEDINLEEGRFRARVFPTSAFPTNPAAKIQVLQDMLGAGVIDNQAFYELALDVPDLEAVRNRVVAPLELIHKRLSKMLYENIYIPPEPLRDLAMALRETVLAIQRAELDDIPEERVDLLRQFLSHVLLLQEQAAAPEPMPPMPDMGMEGMPPDMGMEGMPPMPPDMGALPPMDLTGGAMPPMPPGPPGMMS